GDPSPSSAAFVDRIHIGRAPQTLRSNAAIMPIERNAPAKSCNLFDDPVDSLVCFNSCQMQVRRIKQRRIHHMQWQLKQRFSAEMAVNLRGAGAKPDRFVVTDR